MLLRHKTLTISVAAVAAIARLFSRNFRDLADATRERGHDHDAVRQKYCLLDVVSDQNHCFT
jgi:hypothetical protein